MYVSTNTILQKMDLNADYVFQCQIQSKDSNEFDLMPTNV